MDIYIILCLIVLILVGVVALILQMIGPIVGFLGVIIGPLVGALVGVILGFQKNDKNRMKLEEERRSFFKNLLMHEATESIELIAGVVNLIPVDAWNSIVNSGDIALFKDKAIDLSDTYFQIQIYNYEAKRVRDAIEEVNLHPETTDASHASKLKGRFNELMKPATLKRLEDLKEWLTELKAEPITVTTKVTGNLTVIGPDGKEK
jgi:hypothetical protein